MFALQRQAKVRNHRDEAMVIIRKKLFIGILNITFSVICPLNYMYNAFEGEFLVLQLDKYEIHLNQKYATCG